MRQVERSTAFVMLNQREDSTCPKRNASFAFLNSIQDDEKWVEIRHPIGMPPPMLRSQASPRQTLAGNIRSPKCAQLHRIC